MWPISHSTRMSGRVYPSRLCFSRLSTSRPFHHHRDQYSFLDDLIRASHHPRNTDRSSVANRVRRYRYKRVTERGMSLRPGVPQCVSPMGVERPALGRIRHGDSYIRHGCMGIWLLVEGPGPAHIHRCRTSCVLGPDTCRPDGHSSLGS